MTTRAGQGTGDAPGDYGEPSGGHRGARRGSGDPQSAEDVEGPSSPVAPAAPEASPPTSGVPDALPPPPAPRRPRVLLGLTGSVASIKAAEVCQLLSAWADVRVVATRAALAFFSEGDLPASTRPVLGDEAEWRSWNVVGDPVLHIELRRWADVLVIAPLSANTLAKLALGLADNLLTCVARAWSFGPATPLLVAPAMNTAMWESPLTGRHLATLAELGVLQIPPVSKRLACGDLGDGAMAAPRDIDDAVRDSLRRVRIPGMVALE